MAATQLMLFEDNTSPREENSIDISLLQRMPSLTERALMEIRPLAPLSMVSDMPGSYYKTLRKPDKKMLCGLIENVLGWHIDLSDRKQLYKDIKKLRKKLKGDFIDKYNGSTYLPLLMDYFDIDGSIEIEKLKNVCFYDDLWKRCFRRNDIGGGLLTHVNGCRDIDFSIISEYNSFRDRDKKEKERWVNNHFGLFPFYYTTPTKREFVYLDGVFKIKLCIDKDLLKLLSESLSDNNIGYLGSSEGWVDIKIEKI